MRRTRNNKQVESKSESENEFVVENILDKKVERGNVKYLVKWAGYPDSENTWEPFPNLQNCMYLLNKFEKSIMENQENLSNKNNINNISKNTTKKLKDNELNKSSNNLYQNHLKSFADYNKNTDIRSFFRNDEDAKSVSFLNKKRTSSSVEDKISGSSNNKQSSEFKKKKYENSPERLIKKIADDKTLKSDFRLISNSNLILNISPDSNKKEKKRIRKNNIEESDGDEIDNKKSFDDNSEDSLARIKNKNASKIASSKILNEQTSEEQQSPKESYTEELSNLNNKENSPKHGKGKEKFVLDLYKNKNNHSDNENSTEKSEEIEEDDQENFPRKGQIGRDEPIRIKSAKLIDGELICLIEWQKPNPEQVLLSSEYSHNKLKLFHKMLLLEYYEDRLKFK